jgi:hypothetical protein
MEQLYQLTRNHKGCMLQMLHWKQFQSSYLQKKKVKNAKHRTRKRFEKWCTFNCFKQQGSKDATSFNEEDENEKPVIIKKDNQEFKDI